MYAHCSSFLVISSASIWRTFSQKSMIFLVQNQVAWVVSYMCPCEAKNTHIFRFEQQENLAVYLLARWGRPNHTELTVLKTPSTADWTSHATAVLVAWMLIFWRVRCLSSLSIYSCCSSTVRLHKVSSAFTMSRISSSEYFTPQGRSVVLIGWANDVINKESN